MEVLYSLRQRRPDIFDRIEGKYIRDLILDLLLIKFFLVYIDGRKSLV